MRYIDVSGSSKAEQLITHVILANFELLQKTMEDAKRQITLAMDIAEQLFYQGSSYQSPHISKFACFILEFEGTQQTLLPLPIINDTLVIPAINFTEAILNLQQSIHKELNLKDVSIGYFNLQFDTKNLLDTLQNARNAASRDELASAIAKILSDSLKHERKPTDPLDIAGDYFKLARSLMAKGNITFTRIALRNADKALDAYDAAGNITANQRKRIQAFKSELKAISEAV